ncbi:hypothetical protein F5I97DRAFT_1182741 [Phlebopus sp. FC_14]|nr:hypothetical protein F5I97DRAFT_1182741 [Phlebopus sp. FC_14]
MVSSLWNACAEGNIEIVLALLNDASSVDIEIRDHTGATPLHEAVKNGHVDVVKALLDKGADASFATTQGRPEMYTTNPEIIELLNSASTKTPADGISAQDNTYTQDPHADPSKRFYPVPAPPYGYYLPIGPVPALPDGSPAYYQPPPMPPAENGGFGNLPPPEVARFIPCRYYPACRYGSSCLFAHPQGSYYSAPPQTPTYSAPYDHVTQQQYANYYPPPASFHPSAPVPPHMNPVSPSTAPVHSPPHPPMVHTRSGSDALSPVQAPFSPGNAPPPVPYGPMSPVSPPYPQPAHVPLPLSIPTLPTHQQPNTAGPQSPQPVYPSGPVSAPPFAVRSDTSSYPPQVSHSTYPEVNGGPKSPRLHPQGENYGPPSTYRYGVNHNRRGNIRRGSFGGSRKPACLFYPAGKCKNGDDCRFPHVIPDTATLQPHVGGRGPRQREAANGANGISTIEEKFTAISVRDGAQPGINGTTSSSRSQSTDAGSRSRATKSNGQRIDKKAVVKQRVPNADEFPVLGGSATSSSRSFINGSVNGAITPTAAQVLLGPAPFRKDSTKVSTRSSSPEEHLPESRPEVNVVAQNGTSNAVPSKLPVSFAAAATGAPDAAKEVSVSA